MVPPWGLAATAGFPCEPGFPRGSLQQQAEARTHPLCHWDVLTSESPHLFVSLEGKDRASGVRQTMGPGLTGDMPK